MHFAFPEVIADSNKFLLIISFLFSTRKYIFRNTELPRLQEIIILTNHFIYLHYTKDVSVWTPGIGI